MIFHHKNIRLPHRNYVGTGWFFVTTCCENHYKFFVNAGICDWFLHFLRRDAATHSFAVHAYCLMPDHVHLLLQGLNPTSDLLAFVKVLKIKTSTLFQRKTGKPLWQKKFYDHILRRHESPDDIAWYIWMNPVRAGLCTRPEQYAFLGSLQVLGRKHPGHLWIGYHLGERQKRPPKSAAATRASISSLARSENLAIR